MEKFMHKAKKFFTVRNSLIVVICILSLILIFQNVHGSGGHKSYRNAGGSMTASRGAGGLSAMRIPGMGGGMMGGGAGGGAYRRGGN